jgi:predicted transport protein
LNVAAARLTLRHPGEDGMAALDKAVATQLANIEKKTGKSLTALGKAIAGSGKTKHGEVRAWLIETYGLGYGDANALAGVTLKGLPAAPVAATASGGDAVLDDIYKDKKAHQRPIHEALMKGITAFGPFEIAPKQGYVALRRKKQFAMLGPKTNDRFELGLNLKEDAKDARAKPVPPGGMCQYIVPLTSADEVDVTLIALVRRAYDAAG